MRAFDNIFELKEDEGEDKVLELEEAIRRYIKPGMVLYIDETANAAIRQIIKQFWGTKPGFTLVTGICQGYALDLIQCGLVTKLITSSCSEFYPRAGPSSVIQRAYKQKELEIEGWSLYTLLLRLVAGACGVGFMPTKSILGSSMAQENKDSFIEMEDPFGSSGKVGLVKSLNPDISIIHGWAADRSGNVIMVPSVLSGYGEWGAFASKNGVIATVERIVPTQFIRDHSLLVKVPGYMVNSISVVPFGAHPQSLARVGIEEFEEYEADYEAMEGHRVASKKPETLDAWLKEWVIDCTDNKDYLEKLGHDRLDFLKGKARGLDREEKLLSLPDSTLKSSQYSPSEMMIIAGANILKEKTLKNRYKTILCGVGASALAGWLAYYQLKKAGYDVELMIGSGFYGYAPRPGDARLTNLYNISTCKMVTDIIHLYGVFVGGENNRCLSVLGAGQIDKHGNTNLTRGPQGLYLIGSGGGNDAAQARETVVVTEQSKGRFVDKLPYVTYVGDKVTTVISDKGIFEKVGNDTELTLTRYFADPNLPNTDEVVKMVKENCGWELKVSPSISEIHPPSLDELVLLRLLDPDGHFTR